MTQQKEFQIHYQSGGRISQGHMLSGGERYENVMFDIILRQSVSLCVCVSLCVFMSVRKRSERTGEEESQSEIPARPRANANICLIFCAVLSPPYGTDSNNCEHLGSLQALHAKPLGLFTWDRRPRAASIPTQELPGAGRLSLVTQEGHRD